MAKSDKYKVEQINAEFKILHIYSNPQRLEAKIIFDRDHISQKLIFTLMEISHTHGFGCSPPYFKGPEDTGMTFLIGCVISNKRSINAYVKRMENCLLEIQNFANNFSKQLDFSMLDVSMFGEIDIESFFPEHLAALRDQNYKGSWKRLYNALIKEDRDEEADMVSCCIEFEKANGKDMGLVGHKLGHLLNMLDQVLPTNYDSN